jgi:hypothetical protein
MCRERREREREVRGTHLADKGIERKGAGTAQYLHKGTAIPNHIA